MIRRQLDLPNKLQGAGFDGIDRLLRRYSQLGIWAPRLAENDGFLAWVALPVDDGKPTAPDKSGHKRAGKQRRIGDAVKSIRQEYTVNGRGHQLAHS